MHSVSVCITHLAGHTQLFDILTFLPVYQVAKLVFEIALIL